MTQRELRTSLSYDNKVIEKIVGHSVENVEGLLAINGGFFANVRDKLVNSEDVTSGVNVEVGTEEIAVDLEVIVEYGKDIPAIVEKIKSVIAKDVKFMTKLNLVELNVKVIDVKTKEQHEADTVTLQDRVTDAAQTTGDFVSEKTAQAKEAVEQGRETIKEKFAER